MIELIAICLVLITVAVLFGSDKAAGLVKGIFKLALVGLVAFIIIIIFTIFAN